MDVPPASESALAPNTHVRAIRDALTPQIIQAQARFKIPALSLALVNIDRILWAEGYGLADVEAGIAASAATRYRAGSLAKPLTAVAVMQLVETGRIDLDQPLSASLEGFSVRSRFESPAAPASARGYREGTPIALLPVRDLPAHGIETSAADLSRPVSCRCPRAGSGSRRTVSSACRPPFARSPTCGFRPSAETGAKW